jgi:curved DNA-binding protein CbpA
MAELARGTVFDRPWGKTMAAIGLRGVTGQLTVSDGDKRYVVAFKDGAVVGSKSPLASDATTRLALTLHLISSTQAADIGRRVAADPSRDELAVIVEVARLSEDQALKLRRRTVAQQAARTFAIQRGTFVLDDQTTIAIFPEAAIDVRAIIFMAAKSLVDDVRLATDFEQFPALMQLHEDVIPLLAQYGFSEIEKSLLSTLRNGENTLADLESCGSGLEPKHIRAGIYTLACTGGLIAHTAKIKSKGDQSGATKRSRPVSMVPSTPIVERPSNRQASKQPSYSGVARRDTLPPQMEPARARVSTAPPMRLSSITTPPPSGEHDRPARISTVPPVAALGRVTSPPPVASTGMLPNRGTSVTNRNSAVGTEPPVTIPPANLATGARPVGSGSGRMDAVKDPIAADTITRLIAERLSILARGGNHFVLLGITEDTPTEQIRAAYFALARQLHPDRLTAIGIADAKREAQRLFAQINTAFSVLTHPEKRQQYIQVMRQGGESVVRAKQAEAEALATRILSAEDAFHRGEMAMRRNQFEEAIAEFTIAIAHNSDEGDYHALLAWASFCAAPDKNAVAPVLKKAFERAIALSPQSVTGHLYFGRAERMLGNTASAKRMFNEVLNRHPGHADASAELRVMDSRGLDPDTAGNTERNKTSLFGFLKK